MASLLCTSVWHFNVRPSGSTAVSLEFAVFSLLHVVVQLLAVGEIVIGEWDLSGFNLEKALPRGDLTELIMLVDKSCCTSLST
jgi:hypothetical protein|tara:strand:- start:1178 stop:1426 length:249 start_codon:yes stop_codon:yes gene_type:complete